MNHHAAAEDPARIAIFRIGHIGDTIIALPALWTVRRRFPGAHITYLTQERDAGNLAQGTEVLRPGTVYDEQMVYTLGAGGSVPLPERVKMLLRLRKKRIDLLVYLPLHRTPRQLARDEWFFRLAGVKRIAGMQGYRETVYFPPGKPLPIVRHETDSLLNHLSLDGIRIDAAPRTLMDLGLTGEERAFAAQWLASRGIKPGSLLVGIGAGSKMPAKQWPVERFVEVARRLDAEFHPTFILFGGRSEREMYLPLEQAVSSVVNAAGELSVRHSAAVFERCRLHIGNDTGTMHIAAAAGTPCVAIFSARDWPGRWFPYGEGHAVHREILPCEGCMLEVCDRDNECLSRIDVDRVTQSAQRILLRQAAHVNQQNTGKDIGRG